MLEPGFIKIVDFHRWAKIDRGCVVDNTMNHTMRQFILNRDSWTCVYCGDKDGPFEVDHVMPASRGGLTEERNLVCACRDCNRSKRDKTPEEWRDGVGSL